MPDGSRSRGLYDALGDGKRFTAGKVRVTYGPLCFPCLDPLIPMSGCWSPCQVKVLATSGRVCLVIGWCDWRSLVWF